MLLDQGWISEYARMQRLGGSAFEMRTAGDYSCSELKSILTLIHEVHLLTTATIVRHLRPPIQYALRSPSQALL